MISLVKEREAIGMSSPWTRTPKQYSGSRTPENTTPRHSSAGYLSPYRSPRRPPEFLSYPSPESENYNFYTYGTPPRRREQVDVVEIGTPRRVTMMGREIDLGGFRSLVRPSGGTNNWGGDSPMISRNVPKESMETSYVRFNPLSDLDDEEEERSVRFMKKMTVPDVVVDPAVPVTVTAPAPARRSKRRWLWKKLKWWKRGRK